MSPTEGVIVLTILVLLGFSQEEPAAAPEREPAV